MTGSHRAPTPRRFDRTRAAGLAMVTVGVAVLVVAVLALHHPDGNSAAARVGIAYDAVSAAPSLTVAASEGETRPSTPPPESGPPQTSTAPATPTPVSYTIRTGDTLTTIADATGVPLLTLEQLNTATIGTNVDLIHPGTTLALK